MSAFFFDCLLQCTEHIRKNRKKMKRKIEKQLTCDFFVFKKKPFDCTHVNTRDIITHNYVLYIHRQCVGIQQPDIKIRACRSLIGPIFRFPSPHCPILVLPFRFDTLFSITPFGFSKHILKSLEKLCLAYIAINYSMA